MFEISDETWGKFLDKYGKLVRTIARKIGGDPAIAGIDDNSQDLYIAAMKGFEGFCKPNSYTPEVLTPEEALAHKDFGRYIKTVLWNAKNKKGFNISKKPRPRALTDLKGKATWACPGELVGAPEYEVTQDEVDYEDFVGRTDVRHLMEFYESLKLGRTTFVLPSGGINKTRLAEHFGFSQSKLAQVLERETNIMRRLVHGDA